MRISPLLSTALAKEIFVYAGLSFLALTLILLAQNALRRFADLVAVGATVAESLEVLAWLVPVLTAYTLPISFLFGVIIALCRMSSEGEITALGASGLGLASLLVPTLIFASLISALSFYVMIGVEHRAHRELRTLVETLAARAGMLEPGKFRSLAGRTLFVRERDRENNLRGIMISDRTDVQHSYVIFSERGRFAYDEEKQLFRLGLRNGTLHLDSAESRAAPAQSISFEHLEYEFDVRDLIASLGAAVRPRQMSSAELEEVVRRTREGGDLGELHERDPIEYELEIHRRYALPLAPIVFALIAVPLGFRRGARSRSRGALISLLLAFAYYGLFTQARFLALEGWLVANTALWIPNLIFAAGAGVLMLRSRHLIEN